jgi:MOSC domain-containing protein YiiM
MTARLIGIARVRELRAPLEQLEAATISVANGIEGDARGRKPGRQVSILFREGWENACRDADARLPWTTRRANLWVEGLDFPRRTGWHLQIGETLFEVTMETEPCMLMERAHSGLRQAMVPEWRGGVCCNVIEGGRIALGDAVRIVD